MAQLPAAMAEDDFTQRFVGIFEEVTSTTLELADGIEHQFDSGIAPLAMVRYMARWLDTEIPPDIPSDRQRTLLEAVGQNIEWRGTQRGLLALLKAFTDAEVEIEDTGGVYATQDLRLADEDRITVRVSGTGLLSEQELLHMISDEIPAGATVELIVDSKAVTQEAEPRSMGQEMIEESVISTEEE